MWGVAVMLHRYWAEGSTRFIGQLS
jgi:hypothetical protein